MARIISKTATDHEWIKVAEYRDKFGPFTRYRCQVCGILGNEYSKNMITIKKGDDQGKTLRSLLKCTPNGI